MEQTEILRPRSFCVNMSECSLWSVTLTSMYKFAFEQTPVNTRDRSSITHQWHDSITEIREMLGQSDIWRRRCSKHGLLYTLAHCYTGLHELNTATKACDIRDSSICREYSEMSGVHGCRGDGRRGDDQRRLRYICWWKIACWNEYRHIDTKNRLTIIAEGRS